jgi:hypothetical protein
MRGFRRPLARTTSGLDPGKCLTESHPWVTGHRQTVPAYPVGARNGFMRRGNVVDLNAVAIELDLAFWHD